jgi:threonine dehydrogenase-like Zn-dependent dehydrogenase
VSDVQVGDRVALLSSRSFAEYDIAPQAMVAKLPPQLAGQPFPGEPFACAFNIFRRSDIRPGQTVAIIGIGFLGAILTQLASEAGARVIAISRRQESLDLARSFGAAEVIAMDDHWSIIGQVKALTGEAMCERVIEAVGKQWPLDLAGELVGTGGRLVIAVTIRTGRDRSICRAGTGKALTSSTLMSAILRFRCRGCARRLTR